MEIIARIDISTAAGRKTVRELATNKSVTIEYPDSELIGGQKTYSVEEVFSKVEEKLNEHYGSNIKLKY